jgi:hypothetical protein
MLIIIQFLGTFLVFQTLNCDKASDGVICSKEHKILQFFLVTMSDFFFCGRIKLPD